MKRLRRFKGIGINETFGSKTCKVFLLLLLVVVTAFYLCGCSGSRQGAEAGAEAGAYPLSIEDDLGRQVIVTQEPQRIVSLAPANTEILFALGLGDKVVGVTDYCDYPAEAQDKEKIGDFYGPSVEKIIALAPDIVFATGGIQGEVVQQLEGLNQTVIALNPDSLEDVLKAVEITGKITGQRPEAELLISEMQSKISKVKRETGSIPDDQKPSVFVVIWFEDAKIFTAGKGSFVSDLITLAGGRNLGDAAKLEFPQYSREKLMEEDPKVIISTAHGYPTPETVKEALNLDSLQAIKNNRVFIVQDADLLTLPGPRLVQGLEMTARFLYPEISLE